ncbi:MAG TPA: dihydrolipoamide acetyltransferase family protein, partial [Thermoanaerobaculia bacterium]|nr:dihydrolipoamide acetyltransferase family protein [Thermoanaerobaculia bacterium]
AAGVLTEILAKEGDTVPVNAVVARIAAEGEASAPAPEAKAEAPAAAPQPEAPKADEPTPRTEATRAEEPTPEPASDDRQALTDRQPTTANRQPPTDDSQPATGNRHPATGDDNVSSLDERRRTKSSPLVRKIAAENNVDISRLEGTGVSGRVTKNDILDYLQQPKPAAAASAQPQAAPQQQEAPQARAPRPTPQFAEGENVRLEPLSVMRKRIAHHMTQSKQTSAHVHTVFEIDFTAVEKLRRQYKDAYAERGVKLTYMPFIVQAVIAGLREFPILNASMDESNVVYHRELNIGIAVALEWGLIVPVLKHADELNILGASRAINDLGDRARSKKLSPEDVQGGTFTITNPGVFGGLFGLPIINQPQVAILGVGGIKKRPVVVETKDGDFIAIRSMCYFSLGFDHRLIDGAVADQFMARVKQIIESGQFTM